MIIYKTTNLITGKIYIGQDSKNNPKYLGSGKYLNLSIKKYGRENFTKEFLCECSSREELNEKERYWIKELNSKYPNGYNITEGGFTGPYGPISEEQKKILRKPHGPMSEEQKQLRRGPQSEERKQNTKIAMNRPEVQAKLRKPRGPMSEKNKQSLKIAANRPEVLERNRSPRSEKASKTMKEVRNSPEVKEKCNKPRSEKGKLNIKLGQQKRRENEKRGLING